MLAVGCWLLALAVGLWLLAFGCWRIEFYYKKRGEADFIFVYFPNHLSVSSFLPNFVILKLRIT
jgi:hypothetical protein